ncbi:MAG: winged helix-turn-helix transcriptional regulator [Promethearchaeia archaeon]
MSFEKRRESKEENERDILEDSSYRRLDFTPLQSKLILESKKPEEKISIAEQKELLIPDKESTELIIKAELTEIERDVLEIAKNILKLKRFSSEFNVDSEAEIYRFPIIERLYAKCISKLSFSKGYTKDQIFLAIRNLEKKNWIVTNERRTKFEILNDKKFQKILDFIKRNPGIHARDKKIEEELNITRTPFLKHIMTLERFKLIRSKKIGKTLHFFLADVPEHFDKYKVAFLNPIYKRIIEEFIHDETLTISQLSEKLDIYPGTLQYHIKKLKDLNLIKTSRNLEGKKVYLINIELLKKYNDFFKEPDFSKILRGL